MKLPFGAAAVLLAALGWSSGTAQSQERLREAKPDIIRTCAASIERFCPALAGEAPQPRNAAICLKPYRTSLSLTCRRAVTAVLH